MYTVVYVGPKIGLPAEFEKKCTCEVAAALADGSPPSAAVQTLCEMGFGEWPARYAMSRNEDLDAAVDWLTSAEGQALPAPPVTRSQSSVATASSQLVLSEADGCCVICTEDLNLADAAMRCAGHHGKRHYFHVPCLTSWVRQCRQDNQAPTCPTCRGPLQVQTARLHEFLADQSGNLSAEDRDIIGIVEASADTAGSDGWAALRQDPFLRGLALIVGALALGYGYKKYRESK